jgi:hypothetical protein
LFSANLPQRVWQHACDLLQNVASIRCGGIITSCKQHECVPFSGCAVLASQLTCTLPYLPQSAVPMPRRSSPGGRCADQGPEKRGLHLKLVWAGVLHGERRHGGSAVLLVRACACGRSGSPSRYRALKAPKQVLRKPFGEPPSPPQRPVWQPCQHASIRALTAMNRGYSNERVAHLPSSPQCGCSDTLGSP